jgi:uncharacterized protein YkwD
MGIRVVSAVVAALAVVTGGIAGGAVAVTVFAPSVVAETPVVQATAQDATDPLERTMPPLQVDLAASRTADDAGTGTASVPAEPLPAAAAAPVAAPACPVAIGGSTPGAPGITSPGGVAGTTTADLEAFAAAYNATRIANCLPPVAPANIRYDPCMEQRLFWMAEDPSTDTASAWGHIGSVRSDGLPSVGCDGNLAGGFNNVGATFARKWWDSMGHRLSLYNPEYAGGMDGVCVYFAVTHGGVPDEPVAFARAAARWGAC